LHDTKMEWLANWLSLGVGWPALFWVADGSGAGPPVTPAPAVPPENQGTAS